MSAPSCKAAGGLPAGLATPFRDALGDPADLTSATLFAARPFACLLARAAGSPDFNEA